ncbi:DUF58 domain-containing protein [Paenibacillus sp. CC-CFT747]|nr:DUF58 domain-containing protein [Paenibacillus sp. CC-CFT747]
MSYLYPKSEQPKVSKRFWAVLACFLFSLFFLLFQGGKLASMTFVVVTVLTVYILLGRYSGISRVTGSRRLANLGQDETLEAGTSLDIQIDLHIPGMWPVPYVFVRDRLTHRNKGETVFESSFIPDWNRRGRVEYRTQPLRRGFYRFERSECSTEDIFGVFEHRGPLDLPLGFRVLPQTVPISEWRQLHQMLKGMQSQSTTTRALRETTQINGVREYTYGDRLSRIHWNATARTGTWKSKEFERESLPKTIVVLDREHKHYEEDETFELAVSTAASLMEYGRKNGMAIGLLSVGRDSAYFEPKKSGLQYSRILNHLTEAEADGSHSLLHVLNDRAKMFVPGTFVVLISPNRSDSSLSAIGWIRQRQMNPCHILVGADAAHDPQAWIRLLHSKGSHGYAVGALTELPAALGGRG